MSPPKPTKFNSNANVETFIRDIQAYLDLTHCTVPKSMAQIVRLSLGDDVKSMLDDLYSHCCDFWDMPQNIHDGLRTHYSTVNEESDALAELDGHKMFGLNLTGWNSKLVRLLAKCKQASNSELAKNYFMKNVNNLATNGSLRNQLNDIFLDPSKNIGDLYKKANSLIRNDHGPNYTYKKVSKEYDEWRDHTKNPNGYVRAIPKSQPSTPMNTYNPRGNKKSKSSNYKKT